MKAVEDFYPASLELFYLSADHLKHFSDILIFESWALYIWRPPVLCKFLYRFIAESFVAPATTSVLITFLIALTANENNADISLGMISIDSPVELIHWFYSLWVIHIYAYKVCIPLLELWITESVTVLFHSSCIKKLEFNLVIVYADLIRVSVFNSRLVLVIEFIEEILTHQSCLARLCSSKYCYSYCGNLLHTFHHRIV